MRRKRITLKEVAQLCNASVTAVSRALSGKDGVSEETRQRIIQIANEHNYRPNLLAKNMRSLTTNLIGIVVGDITRTFFIELFRGVEMEARRQSMHVLIANADEDFATEREAVETFLAYNCSGIILCPVSYHDEYLVALGREDVRVVIIDRAVDEELGFSQIMIKNREASRQAVEHLLDHRHNRIAYFSSSHIDTITLRERYQGYVDALVGRGVPVDQNLVRKCTGGDEIMSHTRDLLSQGHRPTAFYIADEPLAIHVVSAIMHQGLSIPGDVSVVMFGNPTWASQIPPGFTCVDRPIQEMGEQAVTLLIEQLRDNSEHKCIKLDARLVSRGSVSERQGAWD